MQSSTLSQVFFVDEALTTALNQKTARIAVEEKKAYQARAEKMFQCIDADESGAVSLQEIRDLLEDPSWSAYMQLLGFDVHDPQRLFQLLDCDSSGEITIDEFLTGCEKLRGQSRSIEVHEILFECKRTQRWLHRMVQHLLTKEQLQEVNRTTAFEIHI